MANPYHDFTAEKIAPHGWEGLNQSVSGLGDAIAAHFQQQKQNEDAIKTLMIKAQLERDNNIAQDRAKGQNELNIEDQRIARAKKMYPGMFPEAQQNNVPMAAPSSMPSPQITPSASPAMSMIDGSVGDVRGNPVNLNPVQGATNPQPKTIAPLSGGIKNPVSAPSGWNVNPNFMTSGRGEMFSKNPDNSLQLQEKQSQFNQREWDKLVKEVNPLTTSGRNPLGMAMKANYNANRALSTLSNPMVTNQEAGNVMADIASIYQNGSPTQFGMSEQGYKTLKSKLASYTQYLSGKPQDALTPDIKNRLLDTLTAMKKTNFDVIKQNIDYTENAKSKLIKSFPDEWQGMKETMLSDGYSGLDSSKQGGSGMVDKIQQARDAGYSEEEIQKYLAGKK